MDLLLLADLAQSSEQLLQRALADPGPLTLALVFSGGALTSNPQAQPCDILGRSRPVTHQLVQTYPTIG